MGKVIAMIFFVIDIIIAILCVVKLLNAVNMNNRGTNKVTRFVRDGAANFAYGQAQSISLMATIFMLVIGLLCKRFWICLPTVIPVVMSFIFKNKSTQNEQRVQDARGVTKGSLEVAAATGEAVGEVAGTAIGTVAGGPIGTKVGQVVGKGIGQAGAKIAGKAGAQMTDVEGIDVNKGDMAGLNNTLSGISQAAVTASEGAVANLREIRVDTIADKTKFMEAAKRVGIAKEEDDVIDVAAKVYDMVPESVKEANADVPEGELAMRFLEGKV